MSDLKGFFKLPYFELMYDVLRMETEGMDSIYEDFIISQIGVFGLNALLTHGLLETCGVINGRQLYVLVKRES